MDVTYYSYSASRADAKWDDPSIIEGFIESRSLKGKTIPKDELLEELRMYDLEELGSVRNQGSFEDVPDELMEALKKVAGPEFEDERYGFINGHLLVELYERLSTEIVEGAAEELDLYSDPEENKRAILDFLKQVRPVANDLKENPDAVFVVEYHGNETMPEQIGEMLRDRTRHLFDRFAEPLTATVTIT